MTTIEGDEEFEVQEHHRESPPIDGEDAMFWTPECTCGNTWPCSEAGR